MCHFGVAAGKKKGQMRRCQSLANNNSAPTFAGKQCQCQQSSLKHPEVIDDNNQTEQHIHPASWCSYQKNWINKQAWNGNLFNLQKNYITKKKVNSIQITYTFCVSLSITFTTSPVDPRLRHVHFVHEKISGGCAFEKEKKHGSSYLHVAICEAGVRDSFDFVSHIQTQRGLHLFFRRQRSIQLGPGGLILHRFDTADTSARGKMERDKWGRTRRADQIWKWWGCAEAKWWRDEAGLWLAGRRKEGEEKKTDRGR